MADVYIRISELDAAVQDLDSIIDEFENATSRSEALEGAIGSPFGRSELRDKAKDFEERWDDKRDDLKDGLKEVRKHVKGVVDGFQHWDSKTAMQFHSKK